MCEGHRDFIAWARSYDTGDLSMRSKAKHDEWQKLLQCELIALNGADDPDHNYRIVRKALGV